ncbi:MAG: hypothetical protein HKN19_06205 [Halioglobus sp.]|nr:hypothetical protein [Halioglobus sp.]
MFALRRILSDLKLSRGVRMEQLLEEIERRWRAMFAALAAGEDLPPGERLRAEGMMEAAVVAGAATAESLRERMADSYAAAMGRSLSEALGEDWREIFPFPEVPAMAQRAPVYPSTRN